MRMRAEGVRAERPLGLSPVAAGAVGDALSRERAIRVAPRSPTVCGCDVAAAAGPRPLVTWTSGPLAWAPPFPR